MRDATLVNVEEARRAVFGALGPWLERLERELPPEAAALRPFVLVQLFPVMGRLVFVSQRTGKLAEVARATEQDLPGAANVEAAAAQFISAGFSALPHDVAEAAFQHASRPGHGIVIVADPRTGSLRCAFAPRGLDAPRWIELFGIEPEAEGAGETFH
jgi:hypothetical protein